MTVVFTPGQEVVRGDLDIFLTDSNSVPVAAAEISYALFFVDPGPPETEVLIGSATRTPVNPSVGEYYAALMIPTNATPGTYLLRWTFRETVASAEIQVAQEFAVASESLVISSPYSKPELDMINALRVLLRDNNPDRNYHFRPPEHEAAVGAYNRVFGYVWEDAELHQYLMRAVDWWDMFPPRTTVGTIDKLVSQEPAWKSAIHYGGMSFALMALAINWVHEEFDYSIGGVSLSLEKSSKYESLKQNAEQQFDKATEAKARTVKYIRGLQQPRFGLGFHGSIGRRGFAPRNFR
jgi:hypothetical protein